MLHTEKHDQISNLFTSCALKYDIVEWHAFSLIPVNLNVDKLSAWIVMMKLQYVGTVKMDAL